MPRAPTSLSLSPGILSQCKPDSVFERDITREMGNEFEFPKTWGCELISPSCTFDMPYRHCDHKVGSSLVESAYPGYEKRSDVGYEGLYNEDDRNNSEVGQLLGRQLRRELGKNWGESAIARGLSLSRVHVLRQGVKSCVLRLARNFWLSASNWPILATI
jgi:hypothetical protein